MSQRRAGADRKIDLGLVPIERLITEIQARTDASVIAFEQTLSQRRQEAEVVEFYHSGSMSACVGLLERFKHNFLFGDAECYEEEEED